MRTCPGGSCGSERPLPSAEGCLRVRVSGVGPLMMGTDCGGRAALATCGELSALWKQRTRRRRGRRGFAQPESAGLETQARDRWREIWCQLCLRLSCSLNKTHAIFLGGSPEKERVFSLTMATPKSTASLHPPFLGPCPKPQECLEKRE